MKISKFLPIVITCLSITACTPINVKEVGTPNVKVNNLSNEGYLKARKVGISWSAFLLFSTLFAIQT